MDWRNEEPDYSSVENLKWNENELSARTKDTVTLDRSILSKGIQTSIGICKEIRNFTTALGNLELEANDNEYKDHIEFRTNDAQTDYFNDSEQEEAMPVFKTRELSTFRLVVQGPEILNFQGTKQSPADIAPYWKKDSRMWLWKTVRLARKIRKTKAKSVISGTTVYRERF